MIRLQDYEGRCVDMLIALLLVSKTRYVEAICHCHGLNDELHGYPAVMNELDFTQLIN